MKKIQPIIYSFDVFDTVITRSVANPVDVFEHVKNKLCHIQGLPDELINNFPHIRRHEEVEARRNSANEDISIEDIYSLIEKKFNIEKEVADKLVTLEMQVERQFIKPIIPTIDEINRLRSQGSEIIFISDMYLPQEFIESILIYLGVFEPEDKLYLSDK